MATLKQLTVLLTRFEDWTIDEYSLSILCKLCLIIVRQQKMEFHCRCGKKTIEKD